MASNISSSSTSARNTLSSVSKQSFFLLTSLNSIILSLEWIIALWTVNQSSPMIISIFSCGRMTKDRSETFYYILLTMARYIFRWSFVHLQAWFALICYLLGTWVLATLSDITDIVAPVSITQSNSISLIKPFTCRRLCSESVLTVFKKYETWFGLVLLARWTTVSSSSFGVSPITLKAKFADWLPVFFTWHVFDVCPILPQL